MVQPRITDLTALFVCDRVSQYSQGWAHNLHPATSISRGLRFQVHTARGLLRLPMLKPLDQALREARVSMYSFHCNAKARLAGLERTLYSICSRQALPSDLRSSNEHHPHNTHTHKVLPNCSCQLFSVADFPHQRTALRTLIIRVWSPGQ